MRFFKKFYEYGLEKEYNTDSIILGYSEFLYKLSKENKIFDEDFLDATYNKLDDAELFLLFTKAEKRKEEAEKKIIEDAKAVSGSTLYGYLTHIHNDIKYVLKRWYLVILLIILFFAWRLIAYPESLKFIMSVFKKIFCSIITFIGSIF